MIHQNTIVARLKLKLIGGLGYQAGEACGLIR